jgi:hypothetical protein
MELPGEPMTDFDGGAYVYKQAQSPSIDYNNGLITTAKATWVVVNEDVYDLHVYLSADGGSHWEEVENGVQYTFANTGTDLRWKIGGSGPFYITSLIISDYH